MNKSKKGFKRELIVTSIILVMIFLILSLHTNSTGAVGSMFKSIVYALFGSGSYLLPYCIIGLTLFGYLKDNNKKYTKQIFGIVLLFITVIGICDLIMYSSIKIEFTFIQKIDYILKAKNEIINGGLVGGVLSYFIIFLFGKIGSIIIYLITSLLSFFLLIGNRKKPKTSLSTNKIKKSMKDLKNRFKSKNVVVEESDDIENTKKDIQNEEETINKKSAGVKSTDVEIDDKLIYKSINTKKHKSELEKASDKKPNVKEDGNYIFPPIDLLEKREFTESNEEEVAKENAKKLVKTLTNFNIETKVEKINIGPTITKYELSIAPGIKVSRILNLSNDIALSLASSEIRIEAPIPGKSAIGIEVPNINKEGVNLRDILQSGEFKGKNSEILVALGKSIEGEDIVIDIKKMPHLLIAGSTGSGKSVCINTIITSILYNNTPDEVKLILVDPKVVELSIYNGIPHLLIPVVTEAKKASSALNWVVREMGRRYELFAENNARDIEGYNENLEKGEGKLPKIVMIIDELSDLMMVSSSEVESSICRIAQMARASGIHMVIATQRPSVDVITGTIKANIPSRISFAVSSQVDSRTILDMVGAEKLLGKGDMLYSPIGASKPVRVQGAFIGDKEVKSVVAFVKKNSEIDYKKEVLDEITTIDSSKDELYLDAIKVIKENNKATISLLQNQLKIGYNRASNIMDQLEEEGIVEIEDMNGSKKIKILNIDLKEEKSNE